MISACAFLRIGCRPSACWQPDYRPPQPDRIGRIATARWRSCPVPGETITGLKGLGNKEWLVLGPPAADRQCGRARWPSCGSARGVPLRRGSSRMVESENRALHGRPPVLRRAVPSVDPRLSRHRSQSLPPNPDRRRYRGGRRRPPRSCGVTWSRLRNDNLVSVFESQGHKQVSGRRGRG